MKFKNSTLKTFINKASLGGLIPTMNMNFKEDGVYSTVTDIPGITLTNTYIPKENIENYEAIGEIYIKDTAMLKNYINSFENEILFSIDGDYTLSLKDDKREAIVLLGAKIVCSTLFEGEFPDLKSIATFDITKYDMTSSYNDMKLLKEGELLIERESDKVTFTIGKADQSDVFKNTVPVEHSDITTQVKIGPVFKNLFESIEGQITVGIERDKPLVIEEKTDDMTFKCIIAPRTD